MYMHHLLLLYLSLPCQRFFLRGLLFFSNLLCAQFQLFTLPLGQHLLLRQLLMKLSKGIVPVDITTSKRQPLISKTDADPISRLVIDPIPDIDTFTFQSLLQFLKTMAARQGFHDATENGVFTCCRFVQCVKIRLAQVFLSRKQETVLPDQFLHYAIASKYCRIKVKKLTLVVDEVGHHMYMVAVSIG